MIKEEKILIKITRRNVTYYKSLGYNVEKIDTEVYIKIEDVNKGSHLKITAICEKCGKETILRIHKYYENKERGGYYSCKSCSREKYKKTNIKKYGVDNPMKSQEIKDKIEKNNMSKYGVKTTLLEEKTKQKINKTKLERYGTEEVLSSKIIREKSKKTLLNKYGVDSYSKTLEFQKIGYANWKKQILEKLEKYNIEHFKLIDDRTIDIKCDKCGNYYNITSKNLYQRKEIQHSILCTVCNPLDYKLSGKEIQLLNFLKENYDGKIITSDRSILNGKELDIYLPDLNLAFEFNGVYWHSELYKDKNYHLNKTEKCLEKGIQLVHIWEDDWHYKQEIVKSMILNKLGMIENKIFARKTEVREVTDNKLIREFLNENHLQGFVGSSIKLGLYYENELVSLMTFGKKRKIMNSKSKTGEYELLRFCNKLNTNIIGGASKLFKYFIRNYDYTVITTYADRSHSQGKLYEVLGFNFVSNTQPGYVYYDSKLQKYNRFGFRKDVLIKEGYDPNKTESEIMIDRGYFRVFNSGNLKYIYPKII